jgi:apolipoprotein N-acyltransferase
MRRWPRLTALLLGAASATGFEPLGLWPVTLVAMALLILLIADTGAHRRAFAIGWAFGVGHFALGLNWIATAFTYQAAMPVWLGWVAVVALSLYLAVYPGLATWGAWALSNSFRARHPREGGDPSPAGSSNRQHQMDSRLRGNDEKRELELLPLTLAFAATWIITEWLRSWVFTGFAWNPLGAIFVDVAAVTEFIGTYGLSGLVVLVAAGLGRLLALLTSQRDRAVPTPRRIVVEVIVFILIPVSVVLLRATDVGAGPRPRPTLTIVQPNVGQQDKWVGAKADANFAKLARLTTPRSDEPRLILWPEAAIPDYLETGYPPYYYDRSPAAARARLTALMNPGDLMLLGALKLEMDRSGEVVGARNAVFTVRPDGSLGPRYDKAHLVPYGEYLPLRPVLSAIGLSRLAPGDLDFWPGPGPRTLNLGRFGSAGIQICYEIIFSGQVVDRANRPDFIFNPSNDAWFGSWGPPQHLAQARLRAIEEGLPVIRATPTGISAVIAADGRILESLPMGVAGRIDTRLPPAHTPTLFARHGNILSLAFAALLFALAIASRRRRR